MVVFAWHMIGLSTMEIDGFFSHGCSTAIQMRWIGTEYPVDRTVVYSFEQFIILSRTSNCSNDRQLVPIDLFGCNIISFSIRFTGREQKKMENRGKVSRHAGCHHGSHSKSARTQRISGRCEALADFPRIGFELLGRQFHKKNNE